MSGIKSGVLMLGRILRLLLAKTLAGKTRLKDHIAYSGSVLNADVDRAQRLQFCISQLVVSYCVRSIVRTQLARESSVALTNGLVLEKLGQSPETCRALCDHHFVQDRIALSVFPVPCDACQF